MTSYKYDKLIKNSGRVLCALSILLSLFTSCKKLVEIPPPASSIITQQVFSNDNQATSAASGMFLKMISSGQLFSSGGMTLFGGVSADELNSFDQSTFSAYPPFQKNKLLSSNQSVSGNFWNPAYATIYIANAIIEGLQNNNDVHDSVKRELIGEAKFVRAFCNFYLVNLFGDISLVTTTNWHNTNLTGRIPESKVYQSIISDLIDAQASLSLDYSVGHGQRIIPNRWAATALLARAYLYISDWDNAEAQASIVINNSNLFKLEDSLNNVFLTGSMEAIWQLQQDNKGFSFNAAPDGYYFIPRKLNSTFSPSFYLTTQLLAAFEPGDKRSINWISSTVYAGNQYYFPYKYKIGVSQATAGGPYSEYYMMLRLGEQYLIRAEARAQKNDIQNSLSDLNKIRGRAGLNNITTNSQTDLLTMIAHERQIELFAEWGHRWLDLKRTNQATAILGPVKQNWSSTAQLFPIPLGEIATDPNLTQNPGY